METLHDALTGKLSDIPQQITKVLQQGTPKHRSVLYNGVWTDNLQVPESHPDSYWHGNAAPDGWALNWSIVWPEKSGKGK